MGPFGTQDQDRIRQEIDRGFPEENPAQIVQRCPAGAVQIYVAMTIDDGPRPSVTQDIENYLAAEDVKATWYIVKTNLESMPANYMSVLQNRVNTHGHEIAIHEALPTAATRGANSVVVSPSGVSDNTEHVTPLPSSRLNRYRDINDWADHVAAFRAELVAAGLSISFYRPPGGLLTELTDMMRFHGNNGDPRDIIRWINTNYRNGSVVAEATRRQALFSLIGPQDRDAIYTTLDTFVRTLDSNGLHLWGGGTILGSNQRDQPNERSIALEHWSVQSWTAEAAPNRNNVVEKLESRFRRRRSATDVNNTVAPYMVILTHDNGGYLPAIRSAVQGMKTHPRVTGGEFCLNFVTMSELRSTIAADPMNAP